MVGRVARGGDRRERAHLLAVAGQPHLHATRPLGQRLGALGVIEVRVGEGDALDPAAGGREHGVEMPGVVGTGVHDPAVRDVGVGAVEGQKRGIRRAHAHHTGGVSVVRGHRFASIFAPAASDIRPQWAVRVYPSSP